MTLTFCSNWCASGTRNSATFVSFYGPHWRPTTDWVFVWILCWLLFLLVRFKFAHPLYHPLISLFSHEHVFFESFCIKRITYKVAKTHNNNATYLHTLLTHIYLFQCVTKSLPESDAQKILFNKIKQLKKCSTEYWMAHTDLSQWNTASLIRSIFYASFFSQISPKIFSIKDINFTNETFYNDEVKGAGVSLPRFFIVIKVYCSALKNVGQFLHKFLFIQRHAHFRQKRRTPILESQAQNRRRLTAANIRIIFSLWNIFCS